MKRILLAAATFLTLTAAQPTLAADAPVYKGQAPAVAAWNWSGFYVGIAGGGGWLSSYIFDDSGNYTGSGAIIGGTLGWNWQTGGWVWGIEGDLSWSNIRAVGGFVGPVVGCIPDCITELKWLATIRGRLGALVTPNVLLYVTGGGAFASVQWGQPNYAPGLYFPTVSQTGWTAGGGIEVLIARNWSAKLEYLYVGFERDTPLLPGACPTFSCGLYNRINMVRGGLNLHF